MTPAAADRPEAASSVEKNQRIPRSSNVAKIWEHISLSASW